MKNLIFILLFIFAGFTSTLAQEDHVLTLEECYLLAEANHPLQRQVELIEQASALSIENMNKNYLPVLALNGQASYQSDVTKVPTKVPLPSLEIEPIDKDWYKLSLDLQQVIYDGGATRGSKILEENEKKVQQQQVLVDLYEIRPMINKAYFNILLMDENLNILKLHKQVIDDRIKEMEAGVKHGVVLESNLLVLRAEKIKIEQNEAELRLARKASVDVLQELISAEISEDTRFILPQKEMTLSRNNRQRPEYGLLSREQLKLQARADMAGVRDFPKVYGFGQAGIGRPALDMLNNSFDGFYIVGLKLSWNFWNWGKTKRERAILELNRAMIDNRKEALDKSLSVQMEQNLADFNKYGELIKFDREIVEMRGQIVETYESQLNNGTITSTEYLTELNAETEARLKLKMHEIQQVQAGIEYLTTIGEL